MSRYCSWRLSPLPQHVQEILNHLVGGGDDAGIGRVGLLGDDQLGELVGDVGVGAFERGADDLARRAIDGRARSIGDLEGAAVDALEIVGAIEVRERDLGELERAAVRVAADDAPLVADRDLLQLAGGEAVLLQQVDLHTAVRIGKLRDAAGAVHELDVAERDAVDRHIVQRQGARSAGSSGRWRRTCS